MTTLSVPPGCTGVELPNGKKLDANKSGKITVDDSVAEKYAMKSTVANMGVLTRASYSFNTTGVDSKVCSSCPFTGFPWQEECPKCGSKMMNPKEDGQ